MKIVIGLLIVVALVVGVILALPFLIDLNKYQDQYKPPHRRRAQSQGSAARHPPDYLATDRCPGGRVCPCWTTRHSAQAPLPLSRRSTSELNLCLYSAAR